MLVEATGVPSYGKETIVDIHSPKVSSGLQKAEYQAGEQQSASVISEPRDGISRVFLSSPSSACHTIFMAHGWSLFLSLQHMKICLLTDDAH